MYGKKFKNFDHIDCNIRCFGGPLEDYGFLDCGKVVGMLGMLSRKQFDMVERLPHPIILIN